MLAAYAKSPETRPNIGTEILIPVTNPIESTFATVRHRTKRTKGCLSRKTGLAMAFKLMMSAQVKWRKLDGRNRLPEIIQGVEFRDGLRHLQPAA
jgi:putative transposase